MVDACVAADRALGLWLASWLDAPFIYPLMIAASMVGTKGAVWMALGVIVWLARPARGMAVWRLLLAIGLAGLIVDGIAKPFVGRARPWVDHPEYRDSGWRPDSSSLPSGHAATAAAGAIALTRAWPGVTVAAWTLAALIAISRVALGVHFPSDVLAGLAIGAACALVACARPPTREADSRQATSDPVST
jgi:membrane-associated phospholipid phosphatase